LARKTGTARSAPVRKRKQAGRKIAGPSNSMLAAPSRRLKAHERDAGAARGPRCKGSLHGGAPFGCVAAHFKQRHTVVVANAVLVVLEYGNSRGDCSRQQRN
jgi:hypothetical protein